MSSCCKKTIKCAVSCAQHLDETNESGLLCFFWTLFCLFAQFAQDSYNFHILIMAHLENINIQAYQQIECNSEVGSSVLKLLIDAVQLRRFCNVDCYKMFIKAEQV